MSITQLTDPAMKTALGFVATPAPTDPTLVYTNAGTTSTLRVGSVANTVPITSVPTLLYNSPSAGQVAPIPIEVTIDPPPPLSPLQNINIAKFHWLKQDPNPLLNQDKYGYFNLGDGSFKVGCEWAGQGPAQVILEGESILVNAIGDLNGGAGFDLGNGGTALNPPTSSVRLFMDATGQLNANHTAPATSTGKQILYRATFCEALSTVSTAVGAGGQVILPITSIISSSQGTVDHFAIGGGNSVVLSPTNADTGVFFATASIAIDTITVGQQLGIAHFTINGVDVPNSASSHTVNPAQQNAIVIQSFLTLNPNDAVSVVLTSTDPLMTATTYPPVVGPPSVPQECAMVLVLTRIA